MKKGLKIALITVLGCAVITLGIVGLINWMSTPRYVIIEKEKSASINNEERDFVITPGKVQITNIWNNKDVIIPLTIYNGEGETKFKISTDFPFTASHGYKNDLNELSFKLDKEIVSLSSNSSVTVNITISKSIKGKLQRQEEWISIEQMPNEKYATIKILRTYILKIFVN